ncbi:MAG: methyltransferase domain-containing protein [Streptosporangiaceae bacterium]
MTDDWTEREDRQAAAYDTIGDRYDEAFPHKEGQLAAGSWLLARLQPGARVLDVGCGTGVPTGSQLVAGGCDVTGIDLSAGMCALARTNVPEARFVQADLLDLDPADGRYDAVLAFFALLHLPKDRMGAALGVLHALLVPGGWFCLSMVEADLDDVPIPFLGSEIRVTGYLRDELRALIESAGFGIEEETPMSYAPASTQATPEVQLFLNCRRT